MSVEFLNKPRATGLWQEIFVFMHATHMNLCMLSCLQLHWYSFDFFKVEDDFDT
jgi:hypothetical protein